VDGKALSFDSGDERDSGCSFVYYIAVLYCMVVALGLRGPKVVVWGVHVGVFIVCFLTTRSRELHYGSSRSL
jgi:hypothetical protein